MDKKKDEIRSKELRVITSTPSRNKEGAGWKLRVVAYYKPATPTEGPKPISVKLESGEYFKGADGQERMSSKGLTLRDVDELLKTGASGLRVIQEVHTIMKTPPPLPIEEPAPPATDAFGQPEPDAPFS